MLADVYDSFEAIPPYTKHSGYSVTVSWSYLEKQLSSMDEPGGMLDLDPDFQRAHVWNDEKRSRYVQHILRGGRSARDLFFNCATWNSNGIAKPTAWQRKVELVDGKQRLDAVRSFLDNRVTAFGTLY